MRCHTAICYKFAGKSIFLEIECNFFINLLKTKEK